MNTTRREFLAAAASGAIASAKPLGMLIGLQPYTVRNEMAKDFEGVLRKVAAFGYESIELGAPTNGKSASELKALLKSVKMVAPSGGYGMPKDDSDWARKIEDATTMGAKYMLVNAPNEWTKSLDGWRRAGELFNKLGAQTKKAGITVAYHNHNFEYRVFDGVVSYDELLKATDPALVTMEMDIFWTTIAGHDPLAYFNKYPGRFQIWHLKDLKKGFGPTTERVEGQPFAEIGAGTIDWKKIFSGAKKAGVKCYFVEQDRWDQPPLDAAKQSCEFLKKFKA
jgi:sugar phosphate isomerase/epimerase